MKKLLLTLGAMTALYLPLSTVTAATAVAPELDMATVQAELPTIKDVARRNAMLRFFNECKNKQLYSCQIAWFDLHTTGLEMIYHVKSGMETWEFLKDKKSTELYRATAIALSSPAYRDGWDLTVRAKQASSALPSEVPARLGLYDDTWQAFTLDIVKQHFQNSSSSYDVYKAFADPRAEWIRYLSLVFAIRGDKTNSYAALRELQTYAKINNTNGVLYNNTLNAIQRYLTTTGATK